MFSKKSIMATFKNPKETTDTGRGTRSDARLHLGSAGASRTGSWREQARTCDKISPFRIPITLLLVMIDKYQSNRCIHNSNSILFMITFFSSLLLA